MAENPTFTNPPPQIVIQAHSFDAEPPMYDSAIHSATADSPPSYDSLDFASKLRKAKDESAGNPVKLLSSICAIVCGSCIITVCLSVSIAMPIAMIVIGAVYKDECPIQKNIPIWLIVAGSFGCLSTILRTISSCISLWKKQGATASPEDNDENKFAKKNCLTSLVELFLFIWFILGNVWVYSIKQNVQYSPEIIQTYCHQTLYLFAFWVITLSWIFTALFCCCCCCVVLVAGCGMGLTNSTNTNANARS